MKQLFFVSTGRCGSKRISEMLKKYLPEDVFSVKHQMDISRLANIIGNLSHYYGNCQLLKQKIYSHILNKYANKKHFVCTDPLVSMIVPTSIINDQNLYIIHIVRDKEDFAQSFFRLTRKKLLSFLAHNFVPFWQIGVFPLENIFNTKIKQKYEKVWELKNSWFEEKYGVFENYQKIRMGNLFSSDFLTELIKEIFDYPIYIPKKELRIKSNKT